jgi:phospholipid/cholesterol/gamma-HCH transport system substrate-binding protein
MSVFRRAASRYTGYVVIIGVVAVAAIIASLYILSQERLAAPWATSYEVKAEFNDLTGVAPGLGLTVNVAGVHVGQISGVRSTGGHAVATLRIDPDELPHVYRDARATLVPNTPLKDMRIDLSPGTPSSGTLSSDQVIPSARTTTPIDFDELLAALDKDTRTYFGGLVTDLGVGTRGRGADLRAMMRSLGPTTEQLREITRLIAARRNDLSRLVHRLAILTSAAGEHQQELSVLIPATNRTLGALASQDQALRASLARLPGTLDLTTGVLSRSRRLTRELGPTLRALTPTAKRLPDTLRDSRTVFQGGTLLPLRELRQFIAAAQPLVGIVPPTVTDMSAQIPPLTDAFRAINYTTNEIAWNPGGSNPGFLYWMSWFAHNSNSVFSTGDANGAVIRGLAMGSCSSLAQPGQIGALAEQVLGTGSGCPGASK